MSASDDTIEYTHWQVFAGEALHDASEPPVDLILDPETLYGLERSIPMFWKTILQVIEIDLRRRAG